MDTHVLKENIEQQLIEVEMIEAMFPGKEEFQMDDETIKEDVNKWMLAATKCSSIDFIPPRISFKLCLVFGDLDDNDEKKGVDAHILLPHEYPSIDVPEIYVKSYKDSINRIRQSELNEALSKYIKENVILGEMCLISLISWLQENCPKYILLSRDDEQLKMSQCNTNTKCEKTKNVSPAKYQAKINISRNWTIHVYNVKTKISHIFQIKTRDPHQIDIDQTSSTRKP